MLKTLSCITLFLISTAAFGQQPTQYTLTVTPQDVQVIGNALGARPLAEVRDLYQRLEAQVIAQNQPKPPAAPAEPAKPAE